MLGSWVSEKIDQVYVRKKVTVKSNKIISITSFDYRGGTGLNGGLDDFWVGRGIGGGGGDGW